MKQLVCEMCGGVDLVKDSGVFVCQTCGTKYSVEEAKKMMVEGTVDVQGTVKIDQSENVKSFLEMSESALSAANGESAIEYANKALEISPKNSEAWILKMRAIEYIATLGDLRLKEVIEAGKNAVQFASEDELEDIEKIVYSYYLMRALALLKLAMNKVADDADIRSTYKRFLAISILTANQNCHRADQGVIKIYEGIASQAIALPSYVPDEIMGKYNELPNILENVGKQYQYYTDALQKRYGIYGSSLTDSALSTRKNTIAEFNKKAQNGRELYDNVRKAELAKRKEEYWFEHAEEKASLDAEKAGLESELIQLNEQIRTIESEETSLSSKNKLNELDSKIDEKRKIQSSLGIFKGKEKKALQAEIDELQKEKDEVYKVYQADTQEIKSRTNPLYADVKKVKARITDIESEFAKER